VRRAALGWASRSFQKFPGSGEREREGGRGYDGGEESPAEAEEEEEKKATFFFFFDRRRPRIWVGGVKAQIL
jgi:hypothetical protein